MYTLPIVLLTLGAHAQQGLQFLHLFKIGVNGKCWRLLKNWYTESVSVVKSDEGHFSELFPIGRAVKQGSVLSPTLFNIIIDSLLRNLELSGQGLSLYGLDVGASAHADDSHAASNCITSAEQQGQCVTAFCAANHLRLNPSKTETSSVLH